MEKMAWLELLIHLFFDPDIQYREKLPQDAPIAQCKQWLVQTQELWAYPDLCKNGQGVEYSIFAPFRVFQAYRCHEILTRREAENIIMQQPVYSLMANGSDDETRRSSAVVDAYCSSSPNPEADGKAFDQEWEKIQATFRQPEK